MAQAENDALAILNRRLANGEITPEQYDELANRLGLSKADKLKSPEPPNQPHSLQKQGALWWIIPPAIIMYIIFSIRTTLPEDAGLSNGATIVILVCIASICYGAAKKTFGS